MQTPNQVVIVKYHGHVSLVLNHVQNNRAIHFWATLNESSMKEY